MTVLYFDFSLKLEGTQKQTQKVMRSFK